MKQIFIDKFIIPANTGTVSQQNLQTGSIITGAL